MNPSPRSFSRIVDRPEFTLMIVLIVEVIFFSVMGRNFNTAENLANLVRHSAEIGLLALVLLPIILTGGIDLSVGSLLGLCAVLFGVFTHDWKLATPLAACLTLGVGAMAGGFNGYLITALRLPPLIVTLGTFSLFRGLAEVITRGTKTYGNFSPEFVALGRDKMLGLPVQGWIFILVALVVGLIVHRSTFGRSFRAIGFAPEGARYAGLPVLQRVAFTYVLAGVVVAVAALILTARLRQARADAGMGYELQAITAVVLGGASIFGGIGTVGGTVLGVACVAVLTTGLKLIPAVALQGIGSELGSLLTGVMLILALALGSILKSLAVRRARDQSVTSTQPHPIL